MTYGIYDASPKAKAKITSYEDAIGVSVNTHHRVVYPFSELEIGKCFTLPIVGTNEVGVRSSAGVCSKKSGKKFTVIKHPALGIIEVARIA